ncbi:MAG: response regulator [Thermoanaerobaculia bacterium]
MLEQQRILTIVISRELFDKLKPFLSRRTLDISTVTNGKGSLVLLHNLAFDLILLEHPLPDMELAELMSEIRGPESHCTETPVLALTREDPEALAAEFGDPQLTFHTLHASADELLMLTADRLGVAARRATRLPVQITVEPGAAQILRACQSVNMSESGMLLRTERPLPLETQVDLRFTLPSGSQTIGARGRVVRYSDPDAEGLVGLAIRFDSIEDENREAIATFIADRTAAEAVVAELAEIE